MGGQTRWRFFPYLAVDYKAAEEYLNAQAEAGWEAEKFFLCYTLVRVRRGTGQPRRYYVDLSNRDTDTDMNYLALCREAGWTDISYPRDIIIYRSEPGACPVPLQTDRTAEERRFSRKFLLSAVLNMALLLLLYPVLYLLLGRGEGLAAFFRSNLLDALLSWRALILLVLLFLLLLTLAWDLAAALRVRRGRMPPVSQRAARTRGWVGVLCMALGILAYAGTFFHSVSPTHSDRQYSRADFGLLADEPLLLARDLGMDDSGTTYWNVSRSDGPVIQYRFCLDPTGGGIRTYRYYCATPALAGWTTRTLMYDNDLQYVGPSDFQPVALEFDESWLSGDGQALLLRQGRVAALVAGDVDWTAAEVQAVLRQRLQLEQG